MGLAYGKSRQARHWSNAVLRQFSYYFVGDVVNVSAGDDLDKEGGKYSEYFSQARTYTITNYSPGAYRGFQGRIGEIELDLSIPLHTELKGQFDVVFNHTVLEHVFNVSLAFENIALLTRDIVITVVPFAQLQHDTAGYDDYWRICPAALRKLYQDNGLHVIYESVNSDFNAATYVLFVGSRHPESWSEHMPPSKPILKAGDWIGEPVWSLRKPSLCRTASLRNWLKGKIYRVVFSKGADLK